MSANPALDAVHRAEEALQGVQLTPTLAARLRGAVEAVTVQPSAREQLEDHISTLRGVVGSDWLHTARRLIRETLAEQAQDVLTAANQARRERDADAVYEAVQQALLTD